MDISRRGFIAGLLGTAAVGPILALSNPEYSTLTMPLSGKVNVTYDVFIFNDNGELKMATAPSGNRPWKSTYIGTIYPDAS